MRACHICHGTNELKPETETWTQFDGTVCTQEIFMCANCRKQLEELESYKLPESWVDATLDKVMNSKAAKAMITIVPLWIYFKGGIL